MTTCHNREVLTDRQVRLLKATGKVQRHVDGNGLYLKVSAVGTKTWCYRDQGAGQDRWITIGRYPAMSLLEARVETSQAASRGFIVPTVQDAWQQYRRVLERAYERPGEIERRFVADVLPRIGTKRLDQVTRADCSALLQRIVDRGSLVAANRTLPDVKKFFTWGLERGWIRENPAGAITRKSVGGRERPKERALVAQEVSLLIGQLLAGKLHPRTKLALGLLLVTGQRPSEVLGYHARERDGAWWTIPAERTKPRRAQKVYLSPQTRALLRLAMRYGQEPFKGMDHRVLDRAVSRLRWANPFTPHDLRRTMATRLADQGVAIHVIEKMLNHRMEGVLAVYNVAEYLPERREAWRLWGRFLAKLRRGHENDRSCPGGSPGRVRGARAVHTDDQGRRAVQDAVL